MTVDFVGLLRLSYYITLEKKFVEKEISFQCIC